MEPMRGVLDDGETKPQGAQADNHLFNQRTLANVCPSCDGQSFFMGGNFHV
jgi:hypothetical protein